MELTATDITKVKRLAAFKDNETFTWIMRTYMITLDRIKHKEYNPINKPMTAYV